jgi:hypothetical protein
MELPDRASWTDFCRPGQPGGAPANHQGQHLPPVSAFGVPRDCSGEVTVPAFRDRGSHGAASSSSTIVDRHQPARTSSAGTAMRTQSQLRRLPCRLVNPFPRTLVPPLICPPLKILLPKWSRSSGNYLSPRAAARIPLGRECFPSALSSRRRSSDLGPATPLCRLPCTT